jgi:RNA polymerase sigma factor (sigma-70 family)
MSTAPLATALTRLRTEAASREGEQRSDRQLLDAYVATNDQSAFTALVQRHGPMVLGVCRRVLQDVHNAEDAFQAVFLVLARKAALLHNGEALTGWLHGVSYRVALRARRDSARRHKHERRVPPRTNPPAWELGWHELQTVLDEEVEQLPLPYRAVFVLCCLEGLSKAEAADQLGVKENTVSSRLARARKRLQESLARRGISLSAVLAALLVSGRGRATVPSPLTHAVVQAASRLGAGTPVTGLSAKALSLAEGVTRTMLPKKFNLATVLLLTLCALGTGLAVFAWPTAETPPAAPSGKVPPAPSTPKEPTDRSITVFGRVVGPDNRPVAGAKFAVIAEETGAPVPQVVSGSDGRFTFQLPRFREVRNPRQVVAWARGFGVDWLSEPRTDAVFRLVPDQPITGRVIDLQGKPVVGATVAVHNVHAGPPGAFDELAKNWNKSADEQERVAGKLDRYIWNLGGLGQAFHTTTAADGTFTLVGMGRDRVITLLVSGAGIADTFVDVATRQGFAATGGPRDGRHLSPPKFTLVTAPDKPITGVVRDEATKAPLAGVRVTGAALVDLPSRLGRLLFHAWPTPATKTDKDGRFTLHGLAKARAYILVADPDEGTEHLHRFAWINDTMGFSPQTAEITLPRGVVLTGRVTDMATRVGVPSRVFYRPLEQNDLLSRFGGYSPPDLPAPWHRGRDTKTDLEGRYRLTVMPGAGVVCFQAYGAGTNGTGYQKAQATKQEIEDGIVDRKFRHFRTVGQGGLFNPEYMDSYKVIRPALTDRTAALNVTVRSNDPPKGRKHP